MLKLGSQYFYMYIINFNLTISFLQNRIHQIKQYTKISKNYFF
jgi:hypothetical protein